MRRIFSVLLSLVIGLSCMVLASATTFAETNEPPPQLRMLYIGGTETLISISGSNAICVGSLTGYQGVTTKVEITLTLQSKLSSSSTWTNFYCHPKQTFNDFRGTVSVSTGIVKGYQYRTMVVYTAYSGTKYETLTQYSGVATY